MLQFLAGRAEGMKATALLDHGANNIHQAAMANDAKTPHHLVELAGKAEAGGGELGGSRCERYEPRGGSHAGAGALSASGGWGWRA